MEQNEKIHKVRIYSQMVMLISLVILDVFWSTFGGCLDSVWGLVRIVALGINSGRAVSRHQWSNHSMSSVLTLFL